ncbi:hypothetical protein EDC01DRAFT_232814 [Geopyxis carbonaria]|nr:hypothetical protein EDC01DRAFT_232814 [Geopyxis carbonaria]
MHYIPSIFSVLQLFFFTLSLHFAASDTTTDGPITQAPSKTSPLPITSPVTVPAYTPFSPPTILSDSDPINPWCITACLHRLTCVEGTCTCANQIRKHCAAECGVRHVLLWDCEREPQRLRWNGPVVGTVTRNDRPAKTMGWFGKK